MIDKTFVFVDRKCLRCDGEGEIGGFNGFITCPECGGTGLLGSYEEMPIIQRVASIFTMQVRPLREKRKLSIHDLAEYFCMKLSHLSELEMGLTLPTQIEIEMAEKWIADKGGIYSDATKAGK